MREEAAIGSVVELLEGASKTVTADAPELVNHQSLRSSLHVPRVSPVLETVRGPGVFHPAAGPAVGLGWSPNQSGPTGRREPC